MERPVEDPVNFKIDPDYLLRKSPTFCMVPWVHLHIMPDASVIPCCVAPYDDHFGDAKKRPLKEIWNSEKYKKLRINMLLDPDEYRIQVLPKEFKKKVDRKLKDSLAELKTLMPDEDFSHYQRQLYGVLEFLHKEDQSHLLDQFSQRTLKLDAIREESFAKTYPELNSLLYETTKRGKSHDERGKVQYC